MLKNVLNLGSVLKKSQQKKINGNGGCEPLIPCHLDSEYDRSLCKCVRTFPS